MFHSLAKSGSLSSAKSKGFNEQEKHRLFCFSLFFFFSSVNPAVFSVAGAAGLPLPLYGVLQRGLWTGPHQRGFPQRWSQRLSVVCWDFEMDLCSVLSL